MQGYKMKKTLAEKIATTRNALKEAEMTVVSFLKQHGFTYAVEQTLTYRDNFFKSESYESDTLVIEILEKTNKKTPTKTVYYFAIAPYVDGKVTYESPEYTDQRDMFRAITAYLEQRK